jgi:hypothetical protein
VISWFQTLLSNSTCTATFRRVAATQPHAAASVAERHVLGFSTRYGGKGGGFRWRRRRRRPGRGSGSWRLHSDETVVAADAGGRRREDTWEDTWGEDTWHGQKETPTRGGLLMMRRVEGGGNEVTTMKLFTNSYTKEWRGDLPLLA